MHEINRNNSRESGHIKINMSDLWSFLTKLSLVFEIGMLFYFEHIPELGSISEDITCSVPCQVIAELNFSQAHQEARY